MSNILKKVHNHPSSSSCIFFSYSLPILLPPFSKLLPIHPLPFSLPSHSTLGIIHPPSELLPNKLLTIHPPSRLLPLQNSSPSHAHFPSPKLLPIPTQPINIYLPHIYKPRSECSVYLSTIIITIHPPIHQPSLPLPWALS